MDMKDYVPRLHDLQSKRDAEKELIELNLGVITLREEVSRAKDKLEEAERELADELTDPERSIRMLDEDIEDVKTSIIGLWDGEQKTIKYEDGKVLKFRTTHRVEIGDGAALMAELLDHFPTNKIVDEYITGFRKLAVRKFISVIPPPPDVVDLIAKTTVALEVPDE